MPKVLEHLHAIANQSVNELSMNAIFSTCYNICISYIKRNHKRFVILFKNLAYDFADAALEIVTPLFLERDGRSCDRLIEAFNNWQPAIETESDALFFLHQLVFIRTERHTGKILAKVDPAYNYYLRIINANILKNNFYKKHFLGLTYITSDDISLSASDLINEERLNRLPLNLFIDRKGFLNNLFDYLKSEKLYEPAIPLNALVVKLREINSPVFKDSTYEHEVTENIFIEDVTRRCLNDIKTRIYKSYVDKKKITYSDAELLNAALRDIIIDFRDGGIKPGLYEYILKYKPGLERQVYKERYDDIFEYIVKLLKKKLVREFTLESK